VTADSDAAPEETIGQRVRRLRLARGLAQKDLAGPGVSYAYVSRIEGGTRRPSDRALRHIAGRLGVDVELLEFGRMIPVAKERALTLADAELELRINNDLDRAEGILRRLLAEEAPDGLEARIRSALASIAARRARYPEAIEQLERVIASGAAIPETQPDAFETLARSYLATGAPQVAVSLLEECIEAVDVDDRYAPLQVRYRRFLAGAFTSFGRLDRAAAVLDEAMHKAEALGGLSDQVGVHWERARLLWTRGDGDAALEAITYARALADLREDTLESARASVFAAQISNYSGRYEEARSHLDRARGLLRFGEAAPDRGLLLAEEAKVQARLGDPRLALQLARDAHALLAEHVRHAPNAAHALAVAHAALGDIDAADADFDRAVSALAEREQWREAIYIAREWADELRAADRYERAYAVLAQATDFGRHVAAQTSSGGTVAAVPPETTRGGRARGRDN
jgi:transcriptional regulator with XRE-family HTH domain